MVYNICNPESLGAGWTPRVRFRLAEGCRFFVTPWGPDVPGVHSVSCKMNTRLSRVKTCMESWWTCSSRFVIYDALNSSGHLVSLFYSAREKSDKFCSETLIFAWGSFTCRKSTTRYPRIYFPSEGNHTQDFYALKKSFDPGWDWTREPRIQWRVW